VARDEARATCPALLFVEVTNALLVYQRAKRLTSEEARHVLEVVETLPFETRSMKALAFPAWIVADTRGLSAYDACYVALAETMGATLITADRRLAAATKDAVLIKG
jgi:predicted nucleic acid-binding protein